MGACEQSLAGQAAAARIVVIAGRKFSFSSKNSTRGREGRAKRQGRESPAEDEIKLASKPDTRSAGGIQCCCCRAIPPWDGIW